MAADPSAITISQHPDMDWIAKRRHHLSRSPEVAAAFVPRASCYRYLVPVTEAVCRHGDVSRFLSGRSLSEHPLDDRRLLHVWHQLLRAPVGIVTKRHAACKSQVALLQACATIGDAGGDHLALKLSEGGQDVQHETVLGGVAELRRCRHDQPNIQPAEIVQEFRTVAHAA